MRDADPLEIPGHVTLAVGKNGLSVAQVTTRWSSAEIYLQGAHVTHFQKIGEPELLFLSRESQFEPDTPIRGGVPVIFPWFGPRLGLPAHGFARTADWELHETAMLPDGAVRLAFRLEVDTTFRLGLIVTVGDCLTLEALVSNLSDEPQNIEICLHTYFRVGAIAEVGVRGLHGTPFYDKVAREMSYEHQEVLQISGEMDRVYQDTSSTVEILDPVLQRILRIEKSGSRSTVVWNPWIEKAISMADLADDEYQEFLCVESGNVGSDCVILAPGECSVLTVVLTSASWAG